MKHLANRAFPFIGNMIVPFPCVTNRIAMQAPGENRRDFIDATDESDDLSAVFDYWRE
ncbi:hypothetical protein [Cupriavidus gilardii]|uniref:hypothetical protein n=1 Tax=Cupriavidus gilardii TaxID=82541 RepID=UPI000A88BAD0|nr:hypothetical protein [Cupriavidus gilardii]